MFDSLFVDWEGSSIPQLTVPTVKQFLLPMPPLAEQDRITSRIEELFSVLDQIQTNIT